MCDSPEYVALAFHVFSFFLLPSTVWYDSSASETYIHILIIACVNLDQPNHLNRFTQMK